jgi:phage terminase Nu1 subunit (DNA packaging protein)
MSIVDRAEMASYLGVDEILVEKLEPQGLPVHSRGEERGQERYDTVEVIEWWIRWQVDRRRAPCS